MNKGPSPPSRVLIIAEAGMNHDGSLGNALRMVDAAAECGVDAVKFQLHIADAETLKNAPTPPYFSAEPRWEYFTRTAFTLEQWKKLKAHCAARRVIFCCSPFSLEAVERLREVGCELYKIPSGEVTNLPLIEAVAAAGKPMLLSSGMSSWSELDAAVETAKRRAKKLTLLQCTSAYPCPHDKVGLNLIGEMARRYKLPVGLSDHTLDNYASFAAVTLGAAALERHFTLSRKSYGSDAAHSLEPGELAELVRGVRAIETMLAHPVDKDAMARSLDGMKRTFEKSVVTVADVPAGARLTAAMLALKKPGTGIPPARLPELIGRRTRRAIARDTILDEKDLERR